MLVCSSWLYILLCFVYLLFICTFIFLNFSWSLMFQIILLCKTFCAFCQCICNLLYIYETHHCRLVLSFNLVIWSWNLTSIYITSPSWNSYLIYPISVLETPEIVLKFLLLVSDMSQNIQEDKGSLSAHILAS